MLYVRSTPYVKQIGVFQDVIDVGYTLALEIGAVSLRHLRYM